MKRSKCAFGVGKVEYLGHVVDSAGVRSDPAKVETVAQWPEPTTEKELQSFLGLANYYA